MAEEVGAHPLVVDLEDEAALGRVIADAESGHGPVDVLVNNAGLAYVSPAARSDADPGVG